MRHFPTFEFGGLSKRPFDDSISSETRWAVLEANQEAGTDGLELLDIFEVPSVKKAGGLEALEGHDDPKRFLTEPKRRFVAA